MKRCLLLLLLIASCTTERQRPDSANPQLEMACKANYPTHGWKPADPPEPAVRRLFSVPHNAPAEFWFRGRDQAIAVCTPCAADSSAVRSFEWYTPGFKEGELALRNCAAKAR